MVLKGKMYINFYTHHIINRETRQYIGLVEASSIPTVNLFTHYGNVQIIGSQFLVAYDSNATLLAVGANQTLIGKNYFGYEVQQFIDQNRILNNLTRILLAGNSGYGVSDYGQGERLITAYPIFVMVNQSISFRR